MTQLYRQTTWSDIQKLSAPRLNLEFDTIVNTWNAHNSATSSWDQLSVSGNATITGNATTTGTAEFDSTSTFYNSSLYGNTPVTGASATATTGGTLGAGTYYYKIYPVFTSKTGSPSNEFTVVIGGANNATSLSWTAVTGATKYRVSRGTSQGSQNGYYETTSTSYTDTNASFTSAGNAYTQASSQWLEVAGNIVMPASSGGIFFRDYVDNSLQSVLQATSAGEMQFSAPANGSSAAVYRFFDASNGGLFSIERVSTRTEIATYASGGGLGDLDITYGTNLNIRPGNSTKQTFTSSGLAMGSTKVTGLSAATTNGDAIRYEQLFGGDVTLTGNLIFNPTTKGIKGTTTNDDASTGDVGEYLSSSVASGSAVTLTNVTTANITSKTLTAGDWDVDFSVGFTNNATLNWIDFGTSTTSATMPSGSNEALPGGDGNYFLERAGSFATSTANCDFSGQSQRISLASSTTIYLVVKASVASGTAKAFGFIGARRIR